MCELFSNRTPTTELSINWNYCNHCVGGFIVLTTGEELLIYTCTTFRTIEQRALFSMYHTYYDTTPVLTISPFYGWNMADTVYINTLWQSREEVLSTLICCVGRLRRAVLRRRPRKPKSRVTAGGPSLIKDHKRYIKAQFMQPFTGTGEVSIRMQCFRAGN